MSKYFNNINSASIIMTRPRITEKAKDLESRTSGRSYTFEVSGRANKSSVAAAVKDLFKIKPVKVNIINTRPKTVSRRGKKGVVGGIKKAMVYLKKGDKIDLI